MAIKNGLTLKKMLQIKRQFMRNDSKKKRRIPLTDIVARIVHTELRNEFGQNGVVFSGARVSMNAAERIVKIVQNNYRRRVR